MCGILASSVNFGEGDSASVVALEFHKRAWSGARGNARGRRFDELERGTELGLVTAIGGDDRGREAGLGDLLSGAFSGNRQGSSGRYLKAPGETLQGREILGRDVCEVGGENGGFDVVSDQGFKVGEILQVVSFVGWCWGRAK
jgi:hypothetical protein